MKEFIEYTNDVNRKFEDDEWTIVFKLDRNGF